MSERWSPDEIAARLAADLPGGSIVNLGIGMPTLVAAHLPPDRGIVLHSENGIIGLGPPASAEAVDPDLIDAGKTPVTLVRGAAIVDHATSFALIRGGRLDIAVLGAYQVAESGDLANWRVAGEDLGSVGGAMDIAIGARRLFVMMRYLDKDGRSKLVRTCTYPLTARACVKRVYTDLAVIDIAANGFVVRDRAPGVTREALQDATAARLRFLDQPVGATE